MKQRFQQNLALLTYVHAHTHTHTHIHKTKYFHETTGLQQLKNQITKIFVFQEAAQDAFTME